MTLRAQRRHARRSASALRAGHFFLSVAPQGAQVYLTCGDAMPGDTIHRPAGD